jgi:hypothetical protein
MSDVSEKGSDFIRDLGDAARQNPLSAALIGMGFLWLFAGGRTVERAAEFVRSSRFDRIPDTSNGAFGAAGSTPKSGAGIASATETLQESAAAALDNAARFGRKQANAVADYAGSLPGAGGEVFETARSNLTELFKAQPLALGAVGLAIGAGIAAALPPSEVEAAYLGETSDTTKAKAAEFAAAQTDRATKVAGEVMGAVTEEARKQGLTVEGAKSAAGDISAKVGRVVDKAAEGISDRVNSARSS